MIHLISLIFTFFATMILVPLNIKFAQKYNLIDKPHQRGLHKNPVPFGGGFSFAMPIIIIQLFGYFIFGTQMLCLAIGGFLMLLLGFLDDKIKVTANYKLLFQIVIISVIYFFGFKIELLTNPFGETIELGMFSFPVTTIWFLVVVNAFNLIDGLDGLASGIALISATVLFAVGFVKSNEIIMFLSLSVIGANFAFLKYNFYPAKIFMGDTGSLFLGFNIAAISIAGNGEFKGITSMTLLVPIIILAIPLLDILFAIIRRVKLKKHIFQADKQHIHHKLHEMGISQKNVALISYFITMLFGLIAFGFSYSSKKMLLTILLFLLFILLIVIYKLFKKEMK
ncbi:MAG: undecaprenyl/decaprenyl-phosphate alpha-N-acetylglucosaminyl 1-phosphate transferase [Candidatus Cloacimonetes bacterium]|jgi:UDP-GlcNAc:undecaprenyl-phosphate/decaprenyl-phosphate GlcNAc-1-phosphate transferase|nr:undecaprenyl/decaprenyl-phosphate alpha-N-acetylglucosaminyl 1-phosphate transferase [Candidatus Cloacimonadota bacterium]MBT6993948.1 undecaprenyl/decaprenyl-phosphate alpha-N-acetylglucosaminyl 1-phosphate transferase [Candidatus Cloacimonadota bacterium]